MELTISKEAVVHQYLHVHVCCATIFICDAVVKKTFEEARVEHYRLLTAVPPRIHLPLLPLALLLLLLPLFPALSV